MSTRPPFNLARTADGVIDLPATGSRADSRETVAHLGRLFWIGGLALLGVAATFGVLDAMRLRGAHRVERSREVGRLARQARALATDRQAAIRGYLLSGDPRSLALEAAARAQLPVKLDSLVALTADNEAQRRRVLEARAALDRWDREFAASVLERPARPDQLAVRRDTSLAGKALFDSVRAAFGTVTDTEDAVYARLVHRQHILRLVTAAAVLLELLTLIGVLLVLRRRAIEQTSELLRQQEQLEEQAIELEHQTAQLQEQAVELEHQTEEAQALAEQLEASNEGLARALAEAESARDAARAAEGQYHLLVNSLAVGVVLMHATDGIVAANPSAERILGLNADQMRGRSSLDPRWRTIHEDGSPFPGEEHPVVVSMRTGEPVSNVVMGVHRPDDTVAWIEVNSRALVRPGESTPYAAVASFVDLTDRKRAEEALRRSEERHRLLFERNPLPMWLYDVETLAILAVNEAAVEHYGYSREEFLAMRVTDLRPAEDVPEMLASRAAPGSGLKQAGSYRHRKKDGTLILVEIVSDDAYLHGRPARLVLARDVTDRDALEARLRQSQKMEAVGQLAGGVAHDFNNLLTVIKGHAELALEDLGDSHPQAGDVKTIREAATRAAALTRQLLAFSRQQMLQPQALDLNGLVKDFEKMVRRVIPADIAIVTNLAADLELVEADPGQLEQVLMNLVVNARDAMHDGGTITIETANVELDPAYPVSHALTEIRPGPYIALIVSDTGAGMDQATQARIFEPFFTTKERGHGTGLGLSTVYGIVKQSGGYIGVYSEPGQGTTFRIFLPRATSGSAQVHHTAEHPVQRGGGETILLVEDEPLVRALARRVLAKNGYRVFEAANGAEGLRVSAESTDAIDLILTDLVMPEMGGRELAAQLQARHPGVRVLFMSGYTEDSALRRNVLQPGEAFLPKPFTPEALVRKVREVLDGIEGPPPATAPDGAYPPPAGTPTPSVDE